MRRLPIYFLIDTSESMVGDPLDKVEDGINTIIKELKTNPYALETVWISIIAFAGLAKTLVPLQELATFYPPKFSIGGGTSLGNGLGQLMFELRKNFVKTTKEQKGDWKPIVFLFTDGTPTDDTTRAVAEWKEKWGGIVNLIAVAIGDEVDTSLLSQLTEHVLLFNNTDANSYKTFFRWITDSIKANTTKIDQVNTGLELPYIDETVIQKINPQKPPSPQNGYVDPNFVIITGKCQNTHRPYLIKFKKTVTVSEFVGYKTRVYKLEGAFALDKSYYELTDEGKASQTINSQELIGTPTCPCCGNQFAIAMCECGEIHCLGVENIEEKNKPIEKLSCCPSCNHVGIFSLSEGGFDIDRSQG